MDVNLAVVKLPTDQLYGSASNEGNSLHGAVPLVFLRTNPKRVIPKNHTQKQSTCALVHEQKSFVVLPFELSHSLSVRLFPPHPNILSWFEATCGSSLVQFASL